MRCFRSKKDGLERLYFQKKVAKLFFICKIGDLKKGKTTVTLRRKSTVLVFENVAARICDQCGHYYLDSETAKMRWNGRMDGTAR